MAKNYPPEKRAEMARKAWDLRVGRGRTTREIAAELGCHHSTIALWLNASREKAREKLEADAVLHLSDQFERLEAAIEQAWRGWERSQEDAVTIKTVETPEGPVTTRTTRGQAGDPRFLAEIRSLLQQQRAVLGLTLKYDQDGEGDPGQPVDPEDLRRAAERNRILREAGAKQGQGREGKLYNPDPET